MAKRIIRLTEADIRNMVRNAVNTVKDKTSRLGYKIEDASDKFCDWVECGGRMEGSPENIEMVFKGNQWTSYKPIQGEDGATYYPAIKDLGAYGEHYGLNAEELVDDINIFFNGRCNVSVVDKNQPEQYPENIQRVLGKMRTSNSWKIFEIFRLDF
jgi:hypothetical protein